MTDAATLDRDFRRIIIELAIRPAGFRLPVGLLQGGGPHKGGRNGRLVRWRMWH